jgi:decaprenylphospho-beta-D-ribofuranose 2-oxidase
VSVSTHTEELAGWGNYPRAVCEVSAPAYPDDVAEHLDRAGTLARGMGRSYGDACFNDHGRTLQMRGLNRFHAFDSATGVLTCEAGVTLGDIIEQFTPRGWFPMITPGTKLVTVGGCIGNDVHGKAHHADGCFSKCVDAFTILVADGRVLRCSREENSDLFWANFGGMGLLGVILTATLRLRKIETTWFNQRVIKAANLDEMLLAIDETATEYPYAVAWVDTLATGDDLGRGVLTVGDHATYDDLPAKLQRDPLTLAPRPQLTVPFYLPNQTLNDVTLRMLNVVLDQVQSRGGPFAHFEGFFYPLDSLHLWNHGYGTRGFTQYQFVVPLDDGHAKVRALLEEIASSGFLPFLNVLKRFGPEEGMLSFPFEGYTYAIDFPIQDGLGDFLKRLDAMVLEFGGRIYLGKDAFLSAEMFAAMYARVDEWKAIKATYDPDNMFTSNLGRRVGLVP